MVLLCGKVQGSLPFDILPLALILRNQIVGFQHCGQSSHQVEIHRYMKDSNTSWQYQRKALFLLPFGRPIAKKAVAAVTVKGAVLKRCCRQRGDRSMCLLFASLSLTRLFFFQY
jgi:hypothetical protein